jgi:Type I restriction enzyme R protein N terminus (HSDR_N)
MLTIENISAPFYCLTSNIESNHIMTNIYMGKDLSSESDVEQKIVNILLTQDIPIGLGYSDFDYRTKVDIRKIAIDKGTKKKLYYPDYAIIIDGLPAVIIEAKTPDENLMEAFRQARLYATEINSSYHTNVNPCERIIVIDGIVIIAGFWDQDDPVVNVAINDCDPLNPEFNNLIQFVSKNTIKKRSEEILKSIRKTSQYYKPTSMLGGRTVINETVGENSFGSNVSVEYKYLFNPETREDRDAIVDNAYIKSQRKLSHVSPIDRIIRAATPKHVVDARKIADTGLPNEILTELGNVKKVKNEICLLIGSVGSGKSTFTDYLRVKALPEVLRNSTKWINLNLNKAPLTRDLIYDWVLDSCIECIKRQHDEIDFDHIDTLQKIYRKEISKVKKGKAALYPQDSDKYIDIIFQEIDKLQNDKSATLNGLIRYLYTYREIVLVVVLDNCDKRNREDQFLMFEVASWLKNSFPCMIFLPLRDTTYDQYRNEPPLDTVIKDLVFRIDPPLLETVIYKRLNFVVREIESQNTSFVYYLPNQMRVTCGRDEVTLYLKSMISSLFQDQLFKRIISGLAGRNIRKGLEILLDFCKSGHVSETEILKMRSSGGEHKLPNHLVAKILLKGKRKYYSDKESHIKNLFHSVNSDSLPNPFIRIAILRWLKKSFREYGPNRTKGFHKISTLFKVLQASGHQIENALDDVSELILAGCIYSESQQYELALDDLIAISPAGFIHLDLLKNINYISTISEDTYFRENQVAKEIADTLVGRGKFRSDSRQAAISNSKTLLNYMSSYYAKYFLGTAKVLEEGDEKELTDISELTDFVLQKANNDPHYSRIVSMHKEYPLGLEVEGQIVSIQRSGLFVEFGLNGSGFIHKSKYNGVSEDLIDAAESGDWVIVQIIKFNNKFSRYTLRLIDI